MKFHQILMGGQFYKEISEFSCFKDLEKNQNIVGIAEEIGGENDIDLIKNWPRK